jgi:protein-disulfide isomerase
MPSGKRARKQRHEAASVLRTPPPVRSKGVGGARARQASPRALAIAGGVVALLAIVLVLALVLSSGGGGGGGGGGSALPSPSDMQGLPPTGSQSWAGALPGAPEANGLFKGIPQHGLTLGNPKAPVEMEMFIDVQCPVCQWYEVNNLPTVVKDDIANGKVQLHLKPWAFIGPQSSTGRLGVIAAADQNKAFEYTKVLYDNQPANSENSGYLNGKWMATIAASVDGLNLAQWRDDVKGSAAQATAKNVDALAKQLNVQGTPTILIGCTGGKLSDISAPGNAPTLQETQQAINAAACS